jgi:hypothetical protein
MPVVAETRTTTDGHPAQDEAHRHRQQHPHVETTSPEAPAAEPTEPESPSTIGTLIDVRV